MKKKLVPYDFSAQTGKMVSADFSKQTGKMVPSILSGVGDLNRECLPYNNKIITRSDLPNLISTESVKSIRLEHPDWWLGFWKNTSIEITYGRLDSAADLVLTFWKAHSYVNQPVIQISLKATVDYRYRTIQISRRSPGQPLPGPDPMIHKLNDGSYIAIYYSGQWRGRYDDECLSNGLYCADNGYLDNITIQNKGGDLTINKIKIMLNDEIILDKIYSRRLRWHDSLTIDNDIFDCRNNKLLYKVPESGSALPREYNAENIKKIKVLKTAAGEFGKTWCRKYNAKWQWELDHVEGWCSDFYCWVVNHNYAYSNRGFPINGIGNIERWFKSQDRWIGPSSLYLYRNLGELIKPGYATVVDGGNHMGMFLYWLSANKDQNASGHYNTQILDEDDADDMVSIINNYTKKNQDNPHPGKFISDAPINYFRMIQGQGDGVVIIGTHAIVNLQRYQHVNEMDPFLKANPPICLWRAPMYSGDNEDGFGKTYKDNGE